ncbi:MAG TPA: discoidin domain-containing protein [Trebonia sp.]|nr:discoidin domain-containing protein [Trebonia sp.]
MHPAPVMDGLTSRRRRHRHRRAGATALAAFILIVASFVVSAVAGPASAATTPHAKTTTHAKSAPNAKTTAHTTTAASRVQSPLAATAASGEGASINGQTEYEAVDAATNGSVIGPDYTQGQLATEAVGREAVQLTATGQYVTFTLTAPANAFDLSYALNQGASGTLSVLVNGTKLSSELSLTSQYSYISTPDITGSDTHHFFNDVRMMLGQTLSAGSTVTFEVGASDTAVPYTIDVADFFDVPAAATQPANSVSVVSEGADPTGTNNSTAAFNTAISTANAAGESVWIPAGTYLISSPLNITKGTLEGAGDWYTTIDSDELIDNTSAVAGPINLSGFAIQGNTVGRHDDSTQNAIDGSLGSGWTVNGLWIQDTNVGFWLQYGNSNCTVENSVVLSTDADGLNFNGNATNCTVNNNFIRNTGDDGLAIWSYPTADSGITFSDNTVEQPNLANGIADYGGSNNTITGNVVADTNALGSGMDISNEAFLTPFSPLSGTITVTDNTLLRTGAYNPNWDHPMCALQYDSYNSAFSGVTVNDSGNAIDNSPYCAYELVSGNGDGYAVSGVNISGDTVNGTGTVIFQAETQGSISVSNVTASNIGVAGIYNSAYPAGSGTFTLNAGTGNSGWSATPVLTSFPSPVTPGALTASPTALTFGDTNTGSTSSAQAVTITNTGSSTQTISSISASGGFAQTNNCGSSLAAGASCTASVTFSPTGSGSASGTLTIDNSGPTPTVTVSLSGFGVTSTTNLALGATMTASGSTSGFPPSNANDGNTSTYWESTDSAFPQWLEANLGSAQAVGSITLDLPPSTAWGTRTQTLSVLGSTNGSTWTTLVASAGYTFNPSTGNTVTISLPSTENVQYLQLDFTANTGWPAGQVSEFEIFPGGAGSSGGGGGTGSSPTNLALGATMTASGYTQTYVPSNANDGNTSTYWESADSAFPQWLEANLGSARALGSITLDLPPSSSWGTRTQTLSVLGSTNGSTWTTLVASAGYTFNPSTGNTVTISLPAGTSDQYLQLDFTGNTAWPAGQVSEFEIFASTS